MLSTMATKLPLPFMTRRGIRGFIKPESLRDTYVRYIDVADIVAIQSGIVGTLNLENARTKNRFRGLDSKIDQQAEQIVTIVHHGNETLDVLVPNREERKELVDCLHLMSLTYHQAKKNVSNEALLLRYIWYDVDLNRDGMIDESEFCKILYRINFRLKSPGKLYRAFAKEIGKEMSQKGNKVGLTYPEVMTLLQQLKKKNELSMANKLWDEIFGADVDVAAANDFLAKFVHAKQGQTEATIEDVEEILIALNGMEINHQEGEPGDILFDRQISRARFEIYLFDLMNSAYDPWALEMDEHVALDKPISQYWINTSHNTYLTGDQLRSTSSVEMYMRALRRGCKCLELDCYDGEKGRECIPVVFHGHTLTSKLLFADIIRCVKNYIDGHPNTYPIILSLENHCSHPHQRAMAKALEDILGNALYRPTKEDMENHLPSPESLRGKVVIKGKRPAEPDDGTEEATDIEYDPYAPDTPAGSPKGGSLPKGDIGSKVAKPPKIVKELARLTLFHGTKYKAFEMSIIEPYSHMHSIGETKIMKIIGKDAANTTLWRHYNAFHLTRTYPAGTRVDSSNYNPTLAWAVGCQLVALNFQTWDTPLVLNDGRFRQMQICGYLPKPESVLGQSAETFTPVSSDAATKQLSSKVYEKGKTVPIAVSATHITNIPMVMDKSPSSKLSTKTQGESVKLRIRILSGSCLPKPYGAKVGETIDPYVTVSVHDVKTEEDGKISFENSSQSSAIVNDNGFCPVWDEEKFKEFMIYSPEVAMVQFSLKESDVALDDKVAEAAIPFDCLRKGYRSIQLFEANNTRTGVFGFAALLVEIEIE
jgi:phosphatidylinositol phospholipase C, delta